MEDVLMNRLEFFLNFKIYQNVFQNKWSIGTQDPKHHSCYWALFYSNINIHVSFFRMGSFQMSSTHTRQLWTPKSSFFFLFRVTLLWFMCSQKYIGTYYSTNFYKFVQNICMYMCKIIQNCSKLSNTILYERNAEHLAPRSLVSETNSAGIYVSHKSITRPNTYSADFLSLPPDLEVRTFVK
jgi:hypothetical protein